MLFFRSDEANIDTLVFVWIYIINFAYSWGPGSWILIAEIFPISIRAKGTSIGASANWMNNFVIAFIVPPMLARLTWGTYIFFAVWTALGGVFIYLRRWTWCLEAILAPRRWRSLRKFRNGSA
jgi:hypothetical protein